MMDAAREPCPACPAPMDAADLGYYQPELHALHDVALMHNWSYRDFCRERDHLLATSRRAVAHELIGGPMPPASTAGRTELARR